MPELTISLSEEVHNALLTAAGTRGRTVDELVEDSLEKAGLLSAHNVATWVREARTGSPLSDEAALELAVAETRAARRERVERARTAAEKP